MKGKVRIDDIDRLGNPKDIRILRKRIDSYFKMIVRRRLFLSDSRWVNWITGISVAFKDNKRKAEKELIRDGFTGYFRLGYKETWNFRAMLKLSRDNQQDWDI